MHHSSIKPFLSLLEKQKEKEREKWRSTEVNCDAKLVSKHDIVGKRSYT